MRQRADAENRATDAAGNLRHWAKGVIEKIIQLEDDRRGRRNVQSDSCAGTIEIEVRNGAIEPHYFIAHDRCNVRAVVELLPDNWRSESVRPLQIESILTGRSFSHELRQFSDRRRIVRIDDGGPGALARYPANDVRASIFTIDYQRPAMIRAVDEKNRCRLQRLATRTKSPVVARHAKLKT